MSYSLVCFSLDVHGIQSMNRQRVPQTGPKPHFPVSLPASMLRSFILKHNRHRSVYNVPIEKELGLAAGTAANTFYIAVGFFGFR